MDQNKLDIGFFEPFRNTIQEINSDGFVRALMPGRIEFDRNVIDQYFYNATIESSRTYAWENFTTYFSGTCKTEDVRNILFSMFFSVTIKMPQWPEQYTDNAVNILSLDTGYGFKPIAVIKK